MPTGRYIAAVSDQVPGYKGLCGKCFEVACDSRLVVDHKGGQYWGAKNACRQPAKSLIVMVSDECTCIGNNKW